MTGMQEVLVIIVIGLVLFNWRKLPDFAGSIGKALTSFKRELAEPDRPAEPGQQSGPPGPPGPGTAAGCGDPAGQDAQKQRHGADCAGNAPHGTDAPPKA